MTTAYCADCDFRAISRLRFLAALAVLRHSHREHRGDRSFGVWIFGRDSWRVPLQRAICRAFGHDWVWDVLLADTRHCSVCTRTRRGVYLNKSRSQS